MIAYLNDKKGNDFPYMIDPHKIFVNIDYIPNGTKKEASNFYLSQLINEIDNLKRICYEMKLNGITRILMPITKNSLRSFFIVVVSDICSCPVCIIANIILDIFVFRLIFFFLN